jgi:chromosome segregation ATPase
VKVPEAVPEAAPKVDPAVCADLEKKLAEVRAQLEQHTTQLEEVIEKQQHFADLSSQLQQHKQHVTALEEAHEEALLGLKANQDEVQIQLDVQKGCAESLPEIQTAMQNIIADLGLCLPRAELENFSMQHAEFQEAAEGSIKELGDDLAAHRDASSATMREVTSLSDAMQGLRDWQAQAEARSRELQELQAELKRKSLQQGEDLLALSSMLEEGSTALPSLVGRAVSLEGRAGALEDSMREMMTSLDSAISRCSNDVQRLASELSESLSKERSRARSEVTAAVDRCQSEAQLRLDSFDNWRSTADNREVIFNERFMAIEQRHASEGQRLSAHDDLLHQLVERCQELPRLLEARVEEARAVAKEDLTASTLTAFQGEMALMAKVAQLSQPPQAPRMIFDGRGWRPEQAALGQAFPVAQGMPIGAPFR